MKIDYVIKNFFESYNSEAIKSIDELSANPSLKLTRSTIKAFNLDESFEDFTRFINEYCKYHVENKDELSNMDKLRPIVEKYINDELFKESNILYEQVAFFVENYITRINKMMTTIDDAKSTMQQEGVNADCIANINEFVDMFVTKLEDTFKPWMETVLWASGYNATKQVNERIWATKNKQVNFI